jgi:hypothetical protein
LDGRSRKIRADYGGAVDARALVATRNPPSLRGATQRFGGIKLGNASYECSDCEYRRGCSGPAERERAAKYRYASAFMIENLMARDAEEGLKAFIDKREPKWEDR